MPKFLRYAAISMLLASLAGRAESLCIYRGADNVRTTVRQEFADSRWVVRARVVAARNGEAAAGGEEAGERWTLYRLRVLRAYKGRVPRSITFFTTRDSGGFYMDRPWVRLPAGHDIGGDYLLFLNPIPFYRGRPAAARGATFVNYNCGQSRRWSEVPAADRRLLETLSRPPRNRP